MIIQWQNSVLLTILNVCLSCTFHAFKPCQDVRPSLVLDHSVDLS